MYNNESFKFSCSLIECSFIMYTLGLTLQQEEGHILQSSHIIRGQKLSSSASSLLISLDSFPACVCAVKTIRPHGSRSTKDESKRNKSLVINSYSFFFSSQTVTQKHLLLYLTMQLSVPGRFYPLISD